ncbi:MAG TPA: 3-oxoadipate enol-lactonase [Parafilimonas sp.]|nr:3-oxoadipate enol-lactonase [Parafilimonas sp.]
MQFLRVDAHTLHYKYVQNALGNEAGRTFVFINSLGTDFRIWDDVADAVKMYGNVLLFDNRGHGLSDVVEDTNSLNDFADDVLALMDHLSIGKVAFVGLSVGGMIAQILASRIPQKIEKLIFCDTMYKIGTEEVWNERIAAVKEKGISGISDGVMQRWFSAKFRQEQAVKVAAYKNMLERTSVPGYIKASELIRDADLENIAAQIKIPALCIVGAEDGSTLPEHVKQLADIMEGARYEVIENSGHIPCVDNPQALSKLIIEFINK